MSDGPTVRRHKSVQEVATPEEFMIAIEKRFGEVQFDLAASANNTKATCYFTKEQDALKQDWHKIGKLCYLNPEFSDIAPWASKCVTESNLGCEILMLVPASVGTNWFRDFVHRKSFVFFLNGRIQFVGHKHPYPKDLMLCAYGFSGMIGHDIWTWQT